MGRIVAMEINGCPQVETVDGRGEPRRGIKRPASIDPTYVVDLGVNWNHNTGKLNRRIKREPSLT